MGSMQMYIILLELKKGESKKTALITHFIHRKIHDLSTIFAPINYEYFIHINKPKITC